MLEATVHVPASSPISMATGTMLIRSPSLASVIGEQLTSGSIIYSVSVKHHGSAFSTLANFLYDHFTMENLSLQELPPSGGANHARGPSTPPVVPQLPPQV